MAEGEEEEAPQKIHHLNGLGMAEEMAPCTKVRVAMVEEVDQSFLVVLVAGCCYCHAMTRGLESGACCAAWATDR